MILILASHARRFLCSRSRILAIASVINQISRPLYSGRPTGNIQLCGVSEAISNYHSSMDQRAQRFARLYDYDLDPPDVTGVRGSSAGTHKRPARPR